MYFHDVTITSLWKGRGPSFEQTWTSYIKRWFVPSSIEIGQEDLEKKILMNEGDSHKKFNCTEIIFESIELLQALWPTVLINQWTFFEF